MSLLEWLASPLEPSQDELVEALAKAMGLSGIDPWGVGDDVMPPCVPDNVLEWLERALPWPKFSPTREAWLAACVFALSRDGMEWRQGNEKIREPWARECVISFLLISGLLKPADKNAAKLINPIMTELRRLPWPDDRLTASENPLAGWVRSVLVRSKSGYVATAEVFAVWQSQNPEDSMTLNEFGPLLTKAILAWHTDGVAPVKNVSRSCCREYAHGNRPRGWGGLILSEGELLRWKFLDRRPSSP